jgi:hypothetical protein
MPASSTWYISRLATRWGASQGRCCCPLLLLPPAAAPPPPPAPCCCRCRACGRRGSAGPPGSGLAPQADCGACVTYSLTAAAEAALASALRLRALVKLSEHDLFFCHSPSGSCEYGWYLVEAGEVGGALAAVPLRWRRPAFPPGAPRLLAGCAAGGGGRRAEGGGRRALRCGGACQGAGAHPRSRCCVAQGRGWGPRICRPSPPPSGAQGQRRAARLLPGLGPGGAQQLQRQVGNAWPGAAAWGGLAAAVAAAAALPAAAAASRPGLGGRQVTPRCTCQAGPGPAGACSRTARRLA